MASRIKIGRHIYALETGDVPRRREAARKLGKTGSREAVEPLCRALRDESWHVRRNAARALGKIGDTEAVEPLCEALNDKTKSVRRAAILALGTLRDHRAVEPLSSMLTAEDPDIRRETAETLVKIGKPALTLLSQSLEGASPASASLAALALRRMQDQIGAQMLLMILALPDLKASERWRALETLRGYPRGFFVAPYLTNTYRFCEAWAQKEAEPEVRDGARAVLEYITLARPSQRDPTTEKGVLLRAAQGAAGSDPADRLLRPVQHRVPGATLTTGKTAGGRRLFTTLVSFFITWLVRLKRRSRHD